MLSLPFSKIKRNDAEERILILTPLPAFGDKRTGTAQGKDNHT
ncbi:hypothetical protein HMPREF0648_1344 [Prevotella bivia JCVIHMP010]|nr:hypothetical protein HMPREF0648_1344 [Prevotella bivia JCVIHMP010]